MSKMSCEFVYFSKPAPSLLGREYNQDVKSHPRHRMAYSSCQDPPKDASGNELDAYNPYRPMDMAKNHDYSNLNSYGRPLEGEQRKNIVKRAIFTNENGYDDNSQVTKLKPEGPKITGKGNSMVYETNYAQFPTHSQYEFNPYKQPCCSYNVAPETAQPFSVSRVLPRLLYPQAQADAHSPRHSPRHSPSAPPLPRLQRRHPSPTINLFDQAQRTAGSLISSATIPSGRSSDLGWIIYWQVCRIFVDLTIITILALVVIFFARFGHPFKRGFFCDDESIRYPLVEDTISTFMLCSVSFLTPIIVFLVVEGFRLLDSSTPRDSWSTVFFSLVRSLYEIFGVFMFGAGLNQITVDVGKYLIGRLRPHFLDACKPKPAFPLGDPEVCPKGGDSHHYVRDYVCTGVESDYEEARLSFPSGHAALAFYSAVYLVVFLQRRMYLSGARFPRHLAQACLLLLAWFTALSRVHDYMHHPTDVAAGALIGTAYALLMTCFVIDLSLTHQGTQEELRALRSPTSSHVQGANNV